jgi:Mg-chelatase subunit ChlD
MNSLTRWRLVLGRFASQQLREPLSRREGRMEAALDHLYSREHRGRGVRCRDGTGGLDPSQLTIPQWLSEVRELFPKEVVEVIERHALDRYGMTELVTDPETLARLEPNLDLVKTLMSFRGHLTGEVVPMARRIIGQVVEELRRRLESEVRTAFTGRVNRFRHGPQKVARNLDWRGTIRANLRHYDVERRQLVIRETRFFSSNVRFLPWQVILCVDQSGSMADSVIHSAVMAGILANLPLVRVGLVVFDTNVVDLTPHVRDPVEVLMSVQLGGGTDIGQALRYCETLVEHPRRAVVVLVSDFAEGGAPAVLLGTTRRMAESGVRMLGLAALDSGANPAYDRAMAARLGEAGMRIAALTPRKLAGWLAGILNSR